MRTNKAELELFKESAIWKDILEEADAAIQAAVYEYPNLSDSIEKNPTMSSAYAMVKMGEISGRIKCCTFIKNLIDYLIDRCDEDKAEEEEKERDNDGTAE